MYLIFYFFIGNFSLKVFLRRVVIVKIKNISVYMSFKDFELLKDNKIVSFYLKRISVCFVFWE